MNESASDPTRPTAFVSYAQSGDWQKTVLQFTAALRRVGGVDAELDLFHSSDHRQWTTFGPNLIDKSDFTLVAVDAAYKRRWEGDEVEGVGAGAAREAAAIRLSSSAASPRLSSESRSSCSQEVKRTTSRVTSSDSASALRSQPLTRTAWRSCCARSGGSLPTRSRH